jgi:hypothetical protein
MVEADELARRRGLIRGFGTPNGAAHGAEKPSGGGVLLPASETVLYKL